MSTRARDFMLANHALSGGPKVAAAMGELIAERDRLRAVVDALRGFLASNGPEATEPYNHMMAALAALDVSPDTGE